MFNWSACVLSLLRLSRTQSIETLFSKMLSIRCIDLELSPLSGYSCKRPRLDRQPASRNRWLGRRTCDKKPGLNSDPLRPPRPQCGARVGVGQGPPTERNGRRSSIRGRGVNGSGQLWDDACLRQCSPRNVSSDMWVLALVLAPTLQRNAGTSIIVLRAKIGKILNRKTGEDPQPNELGNDSQPRGGVKSNRIPTAHRRWWAIAGSSTSFYQCALDTPPM